MLDLGRTFLQSVERSPNALALIDGELRLSYAQWAQQVGAVQRGLKDLGLVRGDHCLTILQNRFEAATLHWACQFSGIVITPINWRAKPDEIDYFIDDASAKALIYEPISAAAVARSDLASQVRRVGVGTLSANAQYLDPPSATALNPLAIAPLRFGDWLGNPCDPVVEADSSDMSLMLYTSGTTGKPKGVPRRQRAERMAALAHVAQNQYAHGERTLGVMPLYHTMGVRSLLALTLLDGVLICMAKWDAETALTLIEREQVSHLYLVPTLYHDLLAQTGFSPSRVRSVRKLGFAGASMPDGLLLRLDKAVQPELFVNHYGSSEIYTFSINQSAVAKPGSAGRAGINTRLRVVPLNAQSGDLVTAPMQEGQIIADLMSDEAFEGYHRRPEANARSLLGGWYFTGDTGYFDEQGELFVTGRVDDMIISGGENISPVDIESVLSLHPSVDEVAVAGLKDERWGQRVVAFVKRRDAVSAESLDLHCRESDLVNFKRPREYVFVREIPKSPVGKILRRQLIAGEYQPESQNSLSHKKLKND